MLHITPALVEANYELLRLTPPFRGWKLPAPDDVEFRVDGSIECRGWYIFKDGKHILSISHRNQSTLQELTKTVAHEMIHVHEQNANACRPDVAHSWRWKRWARSVCKWHCWDYNAF